ncbi:MAG TPA: PHB depolymerase family esterase [Kribbella sp.]|uniref:PHB depolymerase family esterase n=1 Tax=Kribbella sp. TaxID=1871183 RepID=UPI002D76A6A6|nr:PHB depolymerase family esterase [Kribbella sp.]HET6293417.1 PHB depolymerase family esterase [Kribbella sp.]
MTDTSIFYRRGSIPIFASQVDPRLHYLLYVPQQLEDGVKAPLVVVQHGTARTAAKYRDQLKPFAEKYGAVVLTPIFPAGLIDPTDLHNYKFIEYQGIRFDHMLLSIVDEVAERFPVESEQFYLHGFSGGGQFTHRFLYLHPDRLAGASIGAPGRITQLDDSLPWWLGTKGFEQKFGQRIDFDALRRVPIQLVVGTEDVETWEIMNRGESNWMDGAELTGSTRIERLRTLEGNFRSHGLDLTFDLVEGVAHSGSSVLPAVERWIGSLIDTSD